jgi:hypothetical protein
LLNAYSGTEKPATPADNGRAPHTGGGRARSTLMAGRPHRDTHGRHTYPHTSGDAQEIPEGTAM